VGAIVSKEKEMINININMEDVSDIETNIDFSFDGAVCISKTAKVSDCQLACTSNLKMAKAFEVAKKYKEAIRDWIYMYHGDQYRYKEAIFRNLFRISDVIDNGKKK